MREEQKEPFIDKFVSYAGYPIWEKGLVFSGPKEGLLSELGKGKPNKKPRQTVLVPFSFTKDSSLNAILKVSIYDNDTTYRMLYRWQYKRNGYQKKKNVNNADQLALLFMGYESYLFGHKQFTILDSLLFKSKENSIRKVNIKSFNGPAPNKKQLASITICYQTVVWEPFNKGQLVGCDPDDPKCNAGRLVVLSEECETYTWWVGGSTESDWDDGIPLQGQEIIGGGSSGSNNWTDDPCASESKGGIIHRKQPTLGCDDPPGWEPIPITADDGINPPSEENLKTEIKNRPFAFFKDVPCEVLKAWVKTAKHTVPQALLDRLNNIVWKSATVSPGIGAPGFQDTHVASVQKLDDAYSTVVNMDYFPVTIAKLPVVNGIRLTPEQFLNYIRTNINSFVDTKYAEFKPFNWNGINDNSLWNSNNPLGAIVNIKIFPDNGSVIVSDYSNDKWTFTTIYEHRFLKHPVSGNRDFGYISNKDGSYTFYTRGVDRLTDFITTKAQEYANIPFSQGDALWMSFQDKVNKYVNGNHGSSLIGNKEIKRPNWSELKDVIEGKLPLSTLSKDCN